MAACVRTAWLTLGAATVYLEDPAKGYFCTELNLGYPEVRDVVDNRPDQDGVDDRTQFMGGRVVSANIYAAAGAGAVIDDVADSFAPFMVPSARPVLHYVLDRPGTPERTLTLRAAGYSWPIAGADARDIQLQWLAADPVARDGVTKTATALAGTTGAQGRGYPLTFNRAYPAGSGGASTAPISSPGDVPVRPLLRVYGPITTANVHFSASGYAADVRFAAGYVIDAGHWVDVDCARRTVLRDSDPLQSVASRLDWFNTTWPVLPVQPGGTLMSVTGQNTSAVTQVQAIWQDGYLT